MRLTTDCVVNSKQLLMPETSINQYNYLEDFIKKLRSVGRYAFNLSEIKDKFNLSDKALNQSLFRLKTKNEIAQVRKGFYVIVTPEYGNWGMLPAAFFIDDLMNSLSKKYYVGLHSAAALFGAAHQQPMEFFVITEKPALRNISSEKLKLNFFVKRKWSVEDILKKKTDAGYINVSCPSLTALDLLYYTNHLGINHTVTILKELTNEIKSADLVKTARRYPQVTAIQKLGYLLERELDNPKLAEVLFNVLNEKKFFPALLVSHKSKQGLMDEKWKIIRNTQIESDL